MSYTNYKRALFVKCRKGYLLLAEVGESCYRRSDSSDILYQWQSIRPIVRKMVYTADDIEGHLKQHRLDYISKFPADVRGKGFGFNYGIAIGKNTIDATSLAVYDKFFRDGIKNAVPFDIAVDKLKLCFLKREGDDKVRVAIDSEEELYGLAERNGNGFPQYVRVDDVVTGRMCDILAMLRPCLAPRNKSRSDDKDYKVVMTNDGCPQKSYLTFRDNVPTATQDADKAAVFSKDLPSSQKPELVLGAMELTGFSKWTNVRRGQWGNA